MRHTFAMRRLLLLFLPLLLAASPAEPEIAAHGEAGQVRIEARHQGKPLFR